ncbi:hypothetical protein BOTBODRAFT_30869 [Botryobasidium botryosum FD-172 SS1]|uniref:Zn(2)-C6 fungal-type domain-containing protein n=1 Tax=Botryobasidium botryosum (strain FD-172 SS1) TaxID=930990 RepID=A0A067ML97_BOTB1|nr:hypothetical protein BOTBODRAFT_30869 [Botryobasidium botryosum FD-172 SS1]
MNRPELERLLRSRPAPHSYAPTTSSSFLRDSEPSTFPSSLLPNKEEHEVLLERLRMEREFTSFKSFKSPFKLGGRQSLGTKEVTLTVDPRKSVTSGSPALVQTRSLRESVASGSGPAAPAQKPETSQEILTNDDVEDEDEDEQAEQAEETSQQITEKGDKVEVYEGNIRLGYMKNGLITYDQKCAMCVRRSVTCIGHKGFACMPCRKSKHKCQHLVVNPIRGRNTKTDTSETRPQPKRKKAPETPGDDNGDAHAARGARGQPSESDVGPSPSPSKKTRTGGSPDELPTRRTTRATARGDGTGTTTPKQATSENAGTEGAVENGAPDPCARISPGEEAKALHQIIDTMGETINAMSKKIVSMGREISAKEEELSAKDEENRALRVEKEKLGKKLETLQNMMMSTLRQAQEG